MTVDNFEEIKKHLTFESDFDRYIVHIIKRAKDEDGKKYGVNETNRLLKTFYITSLEYLDKKIPVIKDLCETNNARAYILPQVRNNEDCHKSRDKRWILDLNNDNMIEHIVHMGFPRDQIQEKKWTSENVFEFIKKQLKNIGKTENDAYMIPTKNGHCIVTSPFNLQKAYEDCSMLFQGTHKVDGKNVNGWLIKDGMALLYYV